MSKLTAIKTWLSPVSFMERRNFYSLVSFYGRFIKGFSTLMDHLTECLKGKTFEWSESTKRAYEIINEELC